MTNIVDPPALANEKTIMAPDRQLEPILRSGKEHSPTASDADYDTQVPEGGGYRQRSP